MKICRKCQQSKELEEFNRCKAEPDGRQQVCRDCEREYYKANKQRILERQGVYHDEHKEERKAYAAAFYLTHTEQITEQVKRYRATPEGKEVNYAISRRQIAKNPEKARARSAVRYALQTGRLVRSSCEICGTTHDVEAHHDSYAKEDRLKVRWLCPKHHKEFHMKNP